MHCGRRKNDFTGGVMDREAATLIIAQAIREAVVEAYETAAQLAETDSILSWVGGSTGDAKGTAVNIARAIRALKESAIQGGEPQTIVLTVHRGPDSIVNTFIKKKNA